MTWADYDHALDRALVNLRERYPGQVIEILRCFDIAWSGWEGDCQGALISLDGAPMLVAIDQIIDESRFEAEVLARLPEYRRLLDETAGVLSALRHKRGQPGDWTPEDDRLVMIGRIADAIETMPLQQLERVLVLAQHIRDE